MHTCNIVHVPVSFLEGGKEGGRLEREVSM